MLLRNSVKLGSAAALSLLLASCFQPMYGTRTVTDGAGNTTRVNSHQALKNIDIEELDSRTGQVVRNSLLFKFHGGATVSASEKHYTLTIALRESAESPVVDPYTNRPEVETLTLDSSFVLTDKAGVELLRGHAFGRASYDRTRQRYATVRARRDAQDRAAQVLADQINVRIAAHFAAKR